MLRKSVSMFVLLAVSSISVYAASATNLDGNIDNAFASFQEEYNVVGIDKVLNDYVESYIIDKIIANENKIDMKDYTFV